MGTVTYLATWASDTAEVAPNAISGSQYLSALIGVVLPILVGLVTKYSTNSNVKAVLLLLLSGVSGFLTEALNDANFVWEQALFGTVLTFITAVAVRFGFWKPTGIEGAAQRTLIKDAA